MSTSFIRAMERPEKVGKTRRDGFAPGVMYGEGISGSIPVKFEMRKLKRMLSTDSKSARINVKMGDVLKTCILKEIQRHPITSDIVHVDIQAVPEDVAVRIKIPVALTGREQLEHNNLLLQVFNTEIEVEGIIKSLPGYLNIDVSDKIAGDKITVGDIEAGQGVTIINDQDEILAMVDAAREFEVEETTDVSETDENIEAAENTETT